MQGNLMISKILLDADADTMVINKDGHRAVTVALLGSHFEAGLLIGIESFKQAITIANFPAIFELIYLGMSVCLADVICFDLVRVLSTRLSIMYSYYLTTLPSLGIDVNTQNSVGSTALMSAVIHGQYEIVERLLQVKDIDVNLTENDGWSPLFFAAKSNFPFIVKLLLDNGANKYYISPAGFHVYFLATNFPEVIQTLNSFP